MVYLVQLIIYSSLFHLIILSNTIMTYHHRIHNHPSMVMNLEKMDFFQDYSDRRRTNHAVWNHHHLKLSNQTKQQLRLNQRFSFQMKELSLRGYTSILLAGASIAITSFSENDLLSQLYGIILVPVAISFLIYAMHQCKFCFYLIDFHLDVLFVCLCWHGACCCEYCSHFTFFIFLEM